MVLYRFSVYPNWEHNTTSTTSGFQLFLTELLKITREFYYSKPSTLHGIRERETITAQVHC